MKTWKEIGKGALAFVAWMVVFIVSAVIDESVSYFITDHKVTQIMLQAVIQGAAVIVLLILDAKIGTAIGLNMLLLTVMWIFTDEGMAHSMAVIMMLGIIPVYLNKKSEPFSCAHEKGEWIQQERPYEDEIKCTACGALFNVIDNCTEKFDFCPNCGAKMKGGEE